MHVHRTSCRHKPSNIYYRVTLFDHPSTTNQSQWKPSGFRLSSSISVCDLLIIHLPAFFIPPGLRAARCRTPPTHYTPTACSQSCRITPLPACLLTLSDPRHSQPNEGALVQQKYSSSINALPLSQSLWVKSDSVTTQAAESRACWGWWIRTPHPCHCCSS